MACSESVWFLAQIGLPIAFWAKGYKINPGRLILNALVLSHSEKKKTKLKKVIQENKMIQDYCFMLVIHKYY